MAVQSSRAVELARMAAEAARAEVEAEEAGAAAPTPAAGQPWQPQTLQGFTLQPAMQRAVHQVASHLARALHYEGLAVNVAPAPQGHEKLENTSPTVQVQEGQNGRVVRGYSTPAVLSLFATQQQRNGIVVDGQI